MIDTDVILTAEMALEDDDILACGKARAVTQRFYCGIRYLGSQRAPKGALNAATIANHDELNYIILVQGERQSSPAWLGAGYFGKLTDAICEVNRLGVDTAAIEAAWQNKVNEVITRLETALTQDGKYPVGDGFAVVAAGKGLQFGRDRKVFSVRKYYARTPKGLAVLAEQVINSRLLTGWVETIGLAESLKAVQQRLVTL